MMIQLNPETVKRIEDAINRRETSEVRLKIERGEVTVLAVKVTKIS